MVRLTYLNPALPVLLVLSLIGLVSQRQRLRRMGLAAGILLLLWNWSPVTVLLGSFLERWYPVVPAKLTLLRDDEAMVILSGDMVTPEPHRPMAHLGPDSENRLQHGIWLYRQSGKRVPVLVTGGKVKSNAESLAEMMAKRLQTEGVPAADILIDDQAQNTWEHAVNARRILEPLGIRKVALVTEAYHMLRAEGSLRRQGLEVRPVPCCYRMLELDWYWSNLLPDPRAARKNDVLLHEFLGLLAYRLSGRLAP